jgi:hypothetical protein
VGEAALRSSGTCSRLGCPVHLRTPVRGRQLGVRPCHLAPHERCHFSRARHNEIVRSRTHGPREAADVGAQRQRTSLGSSLTRSLADAFAVAERPSAGQEASEGWRGQASAHPTLTRRTAFTPQGWRSDCPGVSGSRKNRANGNVRAGLPGRTRSRCSPIANAVSRRFVGNRTKATRFTDRASVFEHELVDRAGEDRLGRDARRDDHQIVRRPPARPRTVRARVPGSRRRLPRRVRARCPRRGETCSRRSAWRA